LTSEPPEGGHDRADADAKPLRIAHVMTTARTILFLRDHITFLHELGHEYHVIANAAEADDPFVQGPYFHQADLQRKVFAVGDLKAMYQIASAIRKIRPDVVIYSTPKAALVASLVTCFTHRRRRRMLIIRGYRYPTLSGLRRQVVRFMEVFPSFFAATIFCTSKESAETMRRSTPSRIAKNIEVVLDGSGSGLDTESLFNPERSDLPTVAETRSRFGLEPHDKVVLFVGRVCVDKGIEVLLDAFELIHAQVQDAKLLVVGRDDPSDPLGDRVQAQLDELAIRVDFVANSSMPELYAMADLLLFPSKREGFGVAAAESAAMGTPVIASRVGGLQSSVGDGLSGHLVAPEDAHGFAEAAISLLSDEASLNALSASARVFASERFNQARYDEFWLQAYAAAVQ